jgi:putative endonuclease
VPKYCYVYVLRSQVDRRFYVGLTRDLPARLRAHNDGRANSTKERRPFELVYWEGGRNESDAAQREKYLKLPGENVISKIASDFSSWGKASQL